MGDDERDVFTQPVRSGTVVGEDTSNMQVSNLRPQAPRKKTPP